MARPMLHEYRVNVMTKLLGTLAASAALVLAPALVAAQDEWQSEPAPETTQPEEVPPAPPAEPPPAPVQPPPAPQVQSQAQAPVPPGQWVYTQQYGWIWMPYADAYTRVPVGGYGEPYAFVYAPAYGYWAWLAAPWVWGIGPWPVFGVYGAAGFGWYGHGWWRYPGRWHYAPAPAYARYGFHPAYRGGWSAARPGWSRSVPGSFRSAPVPRGGGAAFVGRGGGAAFVGPGGGQAFARPHVAPGGRGFSGGGFGGRSGGGGGGHGRGHR